MKRPLFLEDLSRPRDDEQMKNAVAIRREEEEEDAIPAEKLEQLGQKFQHGSMLCYCPCGILYALPTYMYLHS